MTVEHLRNLLENDRALDSLHKFAHIMARGEVPDRIEPAVRLEGTDFGQSRFGHRGFGPANFESIFGQSIFGSGVVSWPKGGAQTQKKSGSEGWGPAIK